MKIHKNVTSYKIAIKENKKRKLPKLWSCYHTGYRGYIFCFGGTERNTSGYIWMMAAAGRNIGYKTFNCMG
jgi:hypothetical protein